MTHVSRVFLAAFAAACLTACQQDQRPADEVHAGSKLPDATASELQSIIDTATTKYGVVGHSVAILSRGELVVSSKDVGHPDLDEALEGCTASNSGMSPSEIVVA